MKANIYSLKGEKKGEVELPMVFNTKIREDIAGKYFEVFKLMNQQLYSTYAEAGKRHSASGTISHQRHDWKGHYGRGISRVPRKTMWRRGTQFMWIAAEVTGTRGGRQSHPPKGMRRPKKINEKEIKYAIASALAATANESYIKKRYGKIDKLDTSFPIVIESSPGVIKVKDYSAALNKILGSLSDYLFRSRAVRSGKGKQRGRKYKSTAGILIIKTKDEKFNMKGLDIKNYGDLTIKDLYPLGRLTIFTEKALGEMKNA